MWRRFSIMISLYEALGKSDVLDVIVMPDSALPLTLSDNLGDASSSSSLFLTCCSTALGSGSDLKRCRIAVASGSDRRRKAGTRSCRSVRSFSIAPCFHFKAVKRVSSLSTSYWQVSRALDNLRKRVSHQNTSPQGLFEEIRKLSIATGRPGIECSTHFGLRLPTSCACC